MAEMLIKIATWFLSNFIARVLLGAGLAFVSSFVFDQYIHYFLNKAYALLPYIPMSGLLGLAGVDVAISILISALFVRLYLFGLSQGLKVVKK